LGKNRKEQQLRLKVSQGARCNDFIEVGANEAGISIFSQKRKIREKNDLIQAFDKK
jgi:hypothetical protein